MLPSKPSNQFAAANRSLALSVRLDADYRVLNRSAASRPERWLSSFSLDDIVASKASAGCSLGRTAPGQRVSRRQAAAGQVDRSRDRARHGEGLSASPLR
jgi:hypothetical protein